MSNAQIKDGTSAVGATNINPLLAGLIPGETKKNKSRMPLKSALVK
jgi:hypothetical protein